LKAREREEGTKSSKREKEPTTTTTQRPDQEKKKKKKKLVCGDLEARFRGTKKRRTGKRRRRMGE